MKDFLNIVLTKNYFNFAGKMFHEIQGMAMGTKMAPAYANIFMGDLEEKLIEDYHTTRIVWKRYIGDVFCIWPGQPQDFENFVAYLNTKHHSIKFTYESSASSVHFLDLTVYKGHRYSSVNNTLDIKPFFKKKFQYLEYTSAHPRNTFHSLVKGESTRLLRNCSDKLEYKKVQDKMYKAFKDTGYHSSLIRKAQELVPFSYRPTALQNKSSTQNQYDTFLILEYTQDMNLKQINTILKPNLNEKEHVPAPCLSLNKTKCLADTLVRTRLKQCPDPLPSTQLMVLTITPNLEGHSAGCAIAGCKCCSKMSRKTRIFSSSYCKSFPTPSYTNCSTQCVMYLLECTVCSQRNQYIGHNKRSVSKRIPGHRAASRIKFSLLIYKHFDQLNHIFVNDIIITILEKTTIEK